MVLILADSPGNAKVHLPQVHSRSLHKDTAHEAAKFFLETALHTHASPAQSSSGHQALTPQSHTNLHLGSATPIPFLPPPHVQCWASEQGHNFWDWFPRDCSTEQRGSVCLWGADRKQGTEAQRTPIPHILFCGMKHPSHREHPSTQ